MTDDPHQEPILRYRLAVLLAGVLWSLSGLFIKSLTSYPGWHSSALGFTFYRSLFAAAALIPLLRGRVLPSLWGTLVSAGLYALMLGLYVASAQGTTAANAIFLQYTAPLWAAVLGPPFFGERAQKADLWGMLVAMAGVAVLFLGNFQGGERWPLVMGAGSGLLFGIFMLWLRRIRDADPIAVTGMNNAGVTLVCGLILLAVRPGELQLIPRAAAGHTELWPVVALLALAGTVQIAAPYALFCYGLRRIRSVEASLLALVEPLLNPIWVALFAHEVPTPATLVGGALIVVALAGRYALFGRGRARVDPPNKRGL